MPIYHLFSKMYKEFLYIIKIAYSGIILHIKTQKCEFCIAFKKFIDDNNLYNEYKEKPNNFPTPLLPGDSINPQIITT